MNKKVLLPLLTIFLLVDTLISVSAVIEEGPKRLQEGRDGEALMAHV